MSTAMENAVFRIVRATEPAVVKLPRALIQDYRLSLTVRGFAIGLFALPETERASVDSIAQALDLRKDTVRRYLEKLSSTGYCGPQGTMT
jgi:response regulator of citrate/malate metabolism